jgi:hypothetical protein
VRVNEGKTIYVGNQAAAKVFRGLFCVCVVTSNKPNPVTASVHSMCLVSRKVFTHLDDITETF